MLGKIKDIELERHMDLSSIYISFIYEDDMRTILLKNGLKRKFIIDVLVIEKTLYFKKDTYTIEIKNCSFEIDYGLMKNLCTTISAIQIEYTEDLGDLRYTITDEYLTIYNPKLKHNLTFSGLMWTNLYLSTMIKSIYDTRYFNRKFATDEGENGYINYDPDMNTIDIYLNNKLFFCIKAEKFLNSLSSLYAFIAEITKQVNRLYSVRQLKFIR